MERYIGLDAHGQSCTFAVIGPSGRKIRQDVVETNGAALVRYVKSLTGRKHLCLEEGTQSAWLYEILSPHVAEIVVAGVRESRGQKSDVLDAFLRAEELRTGAVKTPVFKAPRRFSCLATAPGLGPIRVAQLLPIVVTPHRFRGRSQFWAYCGLGIVMRSSSDWVRAEGGGWMRAKVQQTRGLNRNHNARFKGVFKGAATTVVTKLPDDPLHDHYQRLLDGGTKPNLAKLTIARRIAAIVLRMWKDEKEYDPEILRGKHEDDIASSAR